MNNLIMVDYSSVHSLPELLTLLHERGVQSNELWVYVSKFHEYQARKKGIPRNGQFELTPLCNLDCKMCYVHLNQNQLYSERLLTTSQWKDIILQAHERGMMNATLTGGECLIYPGFDELYIFLRNLGVRTGIKTNGLLLDRERIDFFKKNQPSGITVSLYGSTNAAYEKVTGHAVFDTVYENLVRLKEVEFPVNVAITPSRYMYEDVFQIIELSKELGYPFSVNLALFAPREETGRVICDLSIDQYLEIFRALHESKPEQMAPLEDYENSELTQIREQKYGLLCGAGRSTFNITWKGIMSGCDNLNSLHESVLEQPFSSAWNKINKDALSFPLPKECNGCVYDSICFDCVAYRSNGMELGRCNPKVCERTKRMASEGFYRV